MAACRTLGARTLEGNKPVLQNVIAANYLAKAGPIRKGHGGVAEGDGSPLIPPVGELQATRECGTEPPGRVNLRGGKSGIR